MILLLIQLTQYPAFSSGQYLMLRERWNALIHQCSMLYMEGWVGLSLHLSSWPSHVYIHTHTQSEWADSETLHAFIIGTATNLPTWITLRQWWEFPQLAAAGSSSPSPSLSPHLHRGERKWDPFMQWVLPPPFTHSFNPFPPNSQIFSEQSWVTADLKTLWKIWKCKPHLTTWKSLWTPV